MTIRDHTPTPTTSAPTTATGATPTPITTVNIDDEVITLKCGRKLAYCQHGAIKDGEPVVFFPGAGFGRRCVPTPDPGLLLREKVRFIVVDRPGYGLSDRHPGRTLREWASDVWELLEHLGLDGEKQKARFLAHSAGTPHLAAVLALEPSLAKAAAFVCPVTPIVGDPPDDRPVETAWGRIVGRFCLLHCGGCLDGIFRAAFGRWQANPSTFVTDMENNIAVGAQKDVDYMKQHQDFFQGRVVDDFGDAVRPPHGVDAMLDDMFRVNREAWGFSYKDIGRNGPVPLQVWYGSDDDTAPHGEWVYQQLNTGNGRDSCNRRRVVVEGGGHAIIHSEFESILRDLLQLGGSD